MPAAVAAVVVVTITTDNVSVHANILIIVLLHSSVHVPPIGKKETRLFITFGDRS